MVRIGRNEGSEWRGVRSVRHGTWNPTDARRRRQGLCILQQKGATRADSPSPHRPTELYFCCTLYCTESEGREGDGEGVGDCLFSFSSSRHRSSFRFDSIPCIRDWRGGAVAVRACLCVCFFVCLFHLILLLSVCVFVPCRAVSGRGEREGEEIERHRTRDRQERDL